jgi:hypothetical protein
MSTRQNEIQRYAFSFKNWLNQPQRVLIACFFVMIISLFLNGTLWKVWGLYRDQSVISEQIIQANQAVKNFDLLMVKAKDSTFIEHEARDKMDLVSENDLLFVFPD